MKANITKREAIVAINRVLGLNLSNSSTHFAHVNSSKQVWWFDIPVEKFTSGQYSTLDLLLVTADSTLLHHIEVPVSYIRDNLSDFYVRDDKASVSLELSSRASNLFQDMRPRSNKRPFVQFLLRSLDLST